VGATSICDSPSCGCGRKTCIQGCQAGGCPESQTCGANHRCAPIACTGDSACSPDFACDSGGHCARRTCQTDADCPTSCVNGSCYSGPGTCMAPLS
jgi:hypothetical protein